MAAQTWRVESSINLSPIKILLEDAQINSSNTINLDQAILNLNQKVFDIPDGIGE